MTALIRGMLGRPVTNGTVYAVLMQHRTDRCILDFWPPADRPGHERKALVVCCHNRAWDEGASWGDGHGDACRECCEGDCGHAAH